MKLSILFVAVVVAFARPSSLAANASPEKTNCTTAREFIATQEYLKDHKELGMSAAQSLKAALEVASHCTGSGLRYMKTVNLLLAGGMSGADSHKIGLEMASKSDAVAGAFLTVYQSAIVRDGMDLDIKSAVSLARSLSTEFNGDVGQSREDFSNIYSYCVKSKVIDLSPTDCGYLAARVCKATEKISGSVSGPFVKLYDFIREDSRGPGLAAKDALRMTEELIKRGSNAAENFMAGYKYAASKSGLALSGKDAIDFAARLTQ